MFKDSKELQRYAVQNYPEVTDQRIDDTHWDLECTTCKIVRGFQVIKTSISSEYSYYTERYEKQPDAPVAYFFRCPVCKSFKLWLVFEFEEEGNGQQRYYRVTSIPSEGLEDIQELPEEPPSLRIAYRQAIRAMDANAHLAAAAMFRRALQVITRDLFGAKPGNLAVELNQCVGRSYNGTVIKGNFAEVGYIIKEAGNQGAHPDRDTDLLEFTSQDAQDLQSIFMDLVSELFIVPKAVEKAKTEFLARRKINPKP
jgi:hypothetical protein